MLFPYEFYCRYFSVNYDWFYFGCNVIPLISSNCKLCLYWTKSNYLQRGTGPCVVAPGMGWHAGIGHMTLINIQYKYDYINAPNLIKKYQTVFWVRGIYNYTLNKNV